VSTERPIHLIRRGYGKQCDPPELDPDDQARFAAQLELYRAELVNNGPATRIVDARIDGETLELDWYLTEYAHALACERRLLPSGRQHPGLTLVTHLRCRDGWVTTRRSGAVATNTGRWQAAAIEGADPGDLDGTIDFDAIAARSLAEELGVHLPAGRLRQPMFQPGGPRTNQRLYLVAELDELSFDEIREQAAHTPDAWEHDRVELRRAGGNGIELDHLWWPAEQ
jgi:hypothetical protein